MRSVINVYDQTGRKVNHGISYQSAMQHCTSNLPEGEDSYRSSRYWLHHKKMKRR